ncbi:coiled-coil domain-containing protein 6-like isoform X1 [Xenia sp. Carnegie-2017]|uniref:coiled-coil domain-containing protein 6-like isoform X1 n=1 Tax=Xenia sp. Carnegie-2017 TaxID=2897299 RepID=UPI001F038AAA|nr:coiled-coil domain-containing protein 6-like isoform X1 [Xenia sp. Carnegie-2017]
MKKGNNMKNSSPNQSSEGPSGFSDSDMSADESFPSDKSRMASLMQEKRVLMVELETYKLKCNQLVEENKALRKASVNIQVKAEQEEEFISNTLMKKIQSLKKEKESLAMNYEQEEEYLTNDLSRKLMQLRKEKFQLEQTLEHEQEFQVNKLMRKIERLEADVVSKQTCLEQLRKEKVDLENTLEQEQESLVNRLWKKMERLESQKRHLQERLEEPVSEPPSPRDIDDPNDLTIKTMTSKIKSLRDEVRRLRGQLLASEKQHAEKMAALEKEERQIKEENIRLQRRLLLEQERRENLGRQLSESESSLEMEDERHFNEYTSAQYSHRERTRSLSPVHCVAFGFSSSSPRSSLHSSTSSLASQSLPTMGTSPPTGRHIKHASPKPSKPTSGGAGSSSTTV